jgi:hypothetical protein
MPVDEDFREPTSPRDCAVLIAPPLTREDFEADIAAAQKSVPARQARGDYAFRMVSQPDHGGNVEKAWREDGVVVADLCQRLISYMQRVILHLF